MNMSRIPRVVPTTHYSTVTTTTNAAAITTRSTKTVQNPLPQCDTSKCHHTRSTTPTSTPTSSNPSSRITSPLVKKMCITDPQTTIFIQPPPKRNKPPPTTAIITSTPQVSGANVYTVPGGKVAVNPLNPSNPFLSLSESINKVQLALNQKIAGVQTTVNNGIENIKKLITDPVEGLEPRLKIVEGYIPTVKKISQTITRDIEPRLASVESKISRLRPVAPKKDGDEEIQVDVCTLDTDIAESLDRRLYTLERKSELTDKSMDILVSWAGSMHRSQAILKKQVQFNTAKHHANELLVGGIYEYHKQDNRKAAIKFFREKMKLTVSDSDVHKAYHTGEAKTSIKGNKTVRCPRQMIVRCSQRLCDLALQNKTVLGGQSDPQGHFTYFVTQNSPEAFKAANAKYKPDIKMIMEDNDHRAPADKQFARVVGTELSINNKLQQELLTPPDPHEVVYALENDTHKLEDIEFALTEPTKIEGSTFCGFGVHLKYLSSVYLAYVKVRSIVPDADHILAAYNISEGHGSCDDGEHFGDLQMAKIIKQKELDNIAIFVTRRKGFKNLGSRRFQIIKNITHEVIQKLQEGSPIPLDRDWLTWGDEFQTPPPPIETFTTEEEETAQKSTPVQDGHDTPIQDDPETTWNTEDNSKTEATTEEQEEEMQT